MFLIILKKKVDLLPITISYFYILFVFYHLNYFNFLKTSPKKDKFKKLNHSNNFFNFFKLVNTLFVISILI